MIRLSGREWAVLVEMARSLCDNLEQSEISYYWTTGTTIVEEEKRLLEKLSQYDVIRIYPRVLNKY